jgi:hypothetical protein
MAVLQTSGRVCVNGGAAFYCPILLSLYFYHLPFCPSLISPEFTIFIVFPFGIHGRRIIQNEWESLREWQRCVRTPAGVDTEYHFEVAIFWVLDFRSVSISISIHYADHFPIFIYYFLLLFR